MTSNSTSKGLTISTPWRCVVSVLCFGMLKPSGHSVLFAPEAGRALASGEAAFMDLVQVWQVAAPPLRAFVKQLLTVFGFTMVLPWVPYTICRGFWCTSTRFATWDGLICLVIGCGRFFVCWILRSPHRRIRPIWFLTCTSPSPEKVTSTWFVVR